MSDSDSKRARPGNAVRDAGARAEAKSAERPQPDAEDLGPDRAPRKPGQRPKDNALRGTATDARRRPLTPRG